MNQKLFFLGIVLSLTSLVVFAQDYSISSLDKQMMDIQVKESPISDNLIQLTPLSPPSPISVFPFNEDFESGTFPSTMVPFMGAESDLFLTVTAAHSSSYGALFEGALFTGWTSYSNVTEAFANVSHVTSLDMIVQPDGSAGVLTMEFDLLQKYTYNNVNYEWFRVLVNGVAIADVNGNYWQQASTPMADDFTRRVYDLSAYQGLGSFNLQLQNAGKYWSGYSSSYDGDQAYVDNFDLFYYNPVPVPITNWALYLGIMLIVGFLVIRFRKRKLA